ncbi:ankyrin repeat and SOCS box protein 8-like [Varroa destructor]|uniref:SOCS box domain-containing protein n=1 Tax=Varroa destructor TaxID=109461 RepID=A0A7M7IYB3_VARDE|nr:ankyrin repeat and SOCS box protein 8-like [Varroa destructor]XP_022644283.1 ankyrin repeat and SOCS box protein 8-like [Varroa destructor]XP_022644284.1 ankyrin repeat and SOCS box protein 8-like [Varroa destructor]XP_022644285.1 ankyrin repeat and SOCS box protein 8-like [Varroa destructor]XP_022644286.1 ankyrin repeat and SOCS box protein 8-like [Varroa destructor]XP_022644287.1 ankyrin repeat and SOCS box protein 8-like [Varroa destructor]
MWYLMENVQRSYTLSERLLDAIGVTAPTSCLGGKDEKLIVENLLREGADVNQAHGTFVPIHSACMMGSVEIVAVLLKWGADVNQLDGFHRSALHYAVEKSGECTQMLLQAGAETESRDLNRNTPLHWAAFRNRADCCRLLLQYHADVNARDRNDDTPLSWAAMKGNLESVRVLFEYNAPPNVMSHARMLPLTRVGILLDGGLHTEEDETCFELLTRGMGRIELRVRRAENPDALLLPFLLSRDVKLSFRLLDLCSAPRPLKALARFAVRQALGPTHLPSVIPLLRLPPSLCDYLLLEY